LIHSVGQFYDFEHLEQVHSKTIAPWYKDVRLEEGGIVTGKVEFRILFKTIRANFRQVFNPPNEIFVQYSGGNIDWNSRYVMTETEDGTLVNGTEEIVTGRLSFLDPIAAYVLRRLIRRIWKEDIEAGIPTGGYPGVPEQVRMILERRLAPGSKPDEHLTTHQSKVRVGLVRDFPKDRVKVVTADGIRLLIAHINDRYYCMESACKHAGGPLEVGVLEGELITCPWHGAVWNVTRGTCERFSSLLPPAMTFDVRIEGDTIYAVLDRER